MLSPDWATAASGMARKHITISLQILFILTLLFWLAFYEHTCLQHSGMYKSGESYNAIEVLKGPVRQAGIGVKPETFAAAPALIQRADLYPAPNRRFYGTF